MRPFQNLINACVATVNFVDDNDGLQVQFQSLLQDKASLGHWPFNRIDEQDTAISHVQNALNLTAEVSMSRSVDNIDLDTTIDDSSIFSENGDTALTFLIV